MSKGNSSNKLGPVVVLEHVQESFSCNKQLNKSCLLQNVTVLVVNSLAGKFQHALGPVTCHVG